ncbi:hydrogenase expression/formation protein HypE [Candidatus Bathyarchaeota archaeon]|nr:MAG: hydrogenase expression/formation protein HypE [Candidatus Bathyarchaeota archaeon]
MDRVVLAHGAGGSIMGKFIKKYILTYFGGWNVEVPLEALDDAAVVDGIVFTTDSYTVNPIFFPGGDIGKLAVSGTVNDLAVMGAEPVALSAGFIIEEGFPLNDLEKILKSMKETCEKAEIMLVTGDTKVLEKGKIDKLIINTSGIGRRSRFLDKNFDVVKKYRPINSCWLLDSNLRSGDKIIVSGTIGDHGLALLSFREGYRFGNRIVSDVTPLNKVIKKVLEVGGVVCMKDPTRGGLSNTLNEWCEKSRVGILVYEDQIPIREDVRVACEMLGIDPLEVGNEGKIVLGVVPEKAEEVLEVLRETNEGRNAQIIGEATTEFNEVVVETTVGGKRILSPPIGDPVPRIC